MNPSLSANSSASVDDGRISPPQNQRAVSPKIRAIPAYLPLPTEQMGIALRGLPGYFASLTVPLVYSNRICLSTTHSVLKGRTTFPLLRPYRASDH